MNEMVKTACFTELQKIAKENSVWNDVAAYAGLPALGALGGAAVGGAITASRGGMGKLKAGLIGGALMGGAVGAGASALMGMGKLMNKADPSGKTLQTMVQLAPAAAAVATMASQGDRWSAVHNKTSSIRPEIYQAVLARRAR